TNDLRRQVRGCRLLQYRRHVCLTQRDHDAGGRLAEERRHHLSARIGNRDLGAHAVSVETAFGEGHRESAVRAIVRRMNQPFGCERDEEILKRALRVEIQGWRFAAYEMVDDFQVLSTTKLAP